MNKLWILKNGIVSGILPSHGFEKSTGIINNLLVNYIQKRRIIAMYKSVGMSKGQNVKMTVIEGFTAGLVGAALGKAYAKRIIRRSAAARCNRKGTD